MHRSSATVGMPAGSPGPCGTGQDVRCSGATGAGQGIAVDPGSTADPVPSSATCQVRKSPARAAADHRSHGELVMASGKPVEVYVHHIGEVPVHDLGPIGRAHV